ncbi:MAG: ArsR family transcriptional regulator [Planctomycetota bacterium]
MSDPAPIPTSGPPGDQHAAVVDRFVEAWGRMGSAWGISRTMAEVHALLYVSGDSLCTDDVMERLQISRGNASMSLRALLDWGVVSRVHRRGDRKDYFSAEQDVWSIFRAIVRERLKRELDPLLASLHEIRDRENEPGRDESAAAIDARLEAMTDFLEMVTAVGDRFVSPSGPGLRLAASLLSAVEDSEGGDP